MIHRLVQMGYCPCFGWRKGKNLKNDDVDTDVGHKCHPSNVPDLSSEVNALGLKINTEMILESSVPKDGANADDKSQTFTYRELATATKYFRPESLVGEGGFGSVYKGQIESAGQVIAVKKLNKTGLQGDKEFLVEVLMLSLLHHPNLVNMIGYCAEGDQRLLVYEFMPLGSLEYHLHDLTPDKEPLDWNTRMQIAAGAARGLHYLHHEADPPVIYRDLKSSNILLGEGFHPKLSDFGLAKFGPSGDRSHVSTRVMGTHGYCAPEYATTGKLTLKSDTYSFGVVLLELITGHKGLDPTRGHGKQMLVDWARPRLKDRKNFLELADPQLKGRFLEPVLHKALEVASMCLQENANARPSMSDVVLALNYLTSRQYDPNTAPCSYAGGDGYERGKSSGRTYRGERGGRILGKEGIGSENKVDVKGSEKDNSPKETTRMLNKDLDREQAVAEAKMWGENWREKRRQSAQSSSDGLSRQSKSSRPSMQSIPLPSEQC